MQAYRIVDSAGRVLTVPTAWPVFQYRGQTHRVGPTDVETQHGTKWCKSIRLRVAQAVHIVIPREGDVEVTR